MSCFSGGRPGLVQRPRRWLLEDSSTSSANPILINWIAPCEVKLEQITWHANIAPTTSAVFALSRDAASGAIYDTVYLMYDPAALAWTDFVCHKPWRFSPGDAIYFGYNNPDNRSCSAAIWVVQVDS